MIFGWFPTILGAASGLLKNSVLCGGSEAVQPDIK
jgi:hypothetical protein